MKLNLKLIAANNTGKRYIIHQGGTGSGKTYTILQYLILYAAKFGNSSISIVSESLPHLKRGCIRDIRNIIATEGLTEKVLENKTDHVFSFSNKSYIECFSADDEAKLRGARRNILYINECNNVDYEAFQQLDVRTRKRTFLDFNPVRRFWVHDELMPSLQETDFTFLQSTYRDNEALSPEEIANIERRKGNANWWRVYGEGEVGAFEGLVFSNWVITGDVMPGQLLGYGIDFGFVHSPTTIVQINECQGELYVKEWLYKIGLHNEEIFAFAQKNIDLNAFAIADSAEPKTIDFLYKKGWHGLKPAVKGEDSIRIGLDLLLERKIHITRGSTNIIKEFNNYMWDTDKAGKPTNKPVKDYDHAIDAIRYLYSYPKKKQIAFV